MNRIRRFEHRFCEFIPESLEQGVVYLAPQHHACLHLCACGCGEEVSTPLSATEFAYSIENKGVTLFPSIGNHDFPCRSHYFITNGAVRWSYKMDPEEIDYGRRLDRDLKASYYGSSKPSKLRHWLTRFANSIMKLLGKK